MATEYYEHIFLVFPIAENSMDFTFLKNRMNRPDFNDMNSAQIKEWGTNRVAELAPLFERGSKAEFQGYTAEQRANIQEYLNALYAKNTGRAHVKFDAEEVFKTEKEKPIERLKIVKAA